MVGWLQEAARQVGHGHLYAPPLLDSLEAREYSQVPCQLVSSLILFRRMLSATVDMKGSMSHLGQLWRRTSLLTSNIRHIAIHKVWSQHRDHTEAIQSSSREILQGGSSIEEVG